MISHPRSQPDTAAPCSCDWTTGECQGPIGCQAVAAAIRPTPSDGARGATRIAELERVLREVRRALKTLLLQVNTALRSPAVDAQRVDSSGLATTPGVMHPVKHFRPAQPQCGVQTADDTDKARAWDAVAAARLDERKKAIEECAVVAEAQAQGFLSPEYAANQPFGSFCERFACEEVAKAIRALALSSAEGK